MAKEITLCVDNYHSVDIFGNIYSKKTRAGKTIADFKMKQSIVCGYDRVSICGKMFSVHRLVACAFLKKPDMANYYEVNHIDGNKRNNNASNLVFLEGDGRTYNEIKNAK